MVNLDKSPITVLVVDDDESVGHIMAAVLRQKGFNVLEACSGFEALRIAGNGANGVRLVLSDFHMPGMNGDELARRLRDSEPAIEVVLMTGDCLVRDDLVAKGFVCLLKPFAFADLASQIQHVLPLRPPPQIMA